MERQIGSDHWSSALNRVLRDPTLNHCFVKGDYDSTRGSTAPFDPETIKSFGWEYVVERWHEGLACVTYNHGRRTSYTLYNLK